MERPDKTSYYLDIAKVVSSRSTCLRKHWGSIIVNNDVIISTGYNGAPRGCTNCSDKGVCWRAENNIPRGTRYELCLTGETEIMLGDAHAKAIKDLVGCGFTVMAYDVKLCKIRPVPAGNVRQTGETDVLMHITIPNCLAHLHTIKCTPDHRFLTFAPDNSLQYVRAEDLTIGTRVVRGMMFLKESYAEVFRRVMQVEKVHLSEPVPVYDMEVPDLHNFPVYIDDCTVIYTHNCAANGVHSEQNAIIAAGRDRCIGATMYVYGHDVESDGMVHNPDSCQMCKRAIINSGIKNVIYATGSKEDGTYEFKESIVEHWIKNGVVEPNPEGY